MNDSLLLALGLGFVLGLKHAMEADHVVAVTTILSEHQSLWRAALVGVFWGAGHTASLMAAGVAVIFLRVTIPAPVAALLEFSVALMILFLGGRILYLLFRDRRQLHVHTHSHGGVTHSHLHFHAHEDAHEPRTPHDADGARTGAGHGSTAVGWPPVLVGMVHGLAGSAALTLLVLTEGILGSSRMLGVAYLLVFGLGSLFGMLLMSLLLGLPFVFAKLRFERIDAPLRLVTGIGSVLFGAYYALNHMPVA